MLLFLCISLALASITIPIQKRPAPAQSPSKSSHFRFNPPSLRGLSSSSSVSNYKDFQYYTQATIGTPPQTFTFIIDTGSTWTWIDVVDCSGCHVGNKFSPEESSTYKNTTQPKALNYLKGNSNGYLSTDVISIGDSNSLTVTDQSFILIYSESNFDGLKSDGLMGFGFEALSDGVSSLMSNLKSQGKIQKKQFSIYLNEANSDSDLLNLGNSNMMIDGYDISKYSSDDTFTYINLIADSGYWEVPCDSMSFGGISYFGGVSAIIDTGSSFITGPKNDIYQILNTLYDYYYCKVNVYNEVYCDCSKSYPTLIFKLSGNIFALKQSDYFEVFAGYCYPIFYYATGLNSWILGDNFIRRFYINFDMDGRRIGFANIRTSQDSGGSSSGNSGGGDSNNDGDGSGSDQDSTGNEDTGDSSGSFAVWKIALIVVLPTVAIIALATAIGIKIYKNKTRGKPAREITSSSGTEKELKNKPSITSHACQNDNETKYISKISNSEDISGAKANNKNEEAKNIEKAENISEESKEEESDRSASESNK